MDQLHEKLERLRTTLRDFGTVLIAFSGGVDSTFLLRIAVDELGAQAVGCTARSETYPEREFREAVDLAESMGARHVVLETNELDIEGYRDNPPERCYYCKHELFRGLVELAETEGLAVVCDASNADDLNDFRPGRRAATELGVRSPLAELGFTKNDIRNLSRDLNLPTWSKPAFACLASRFPYGDSITAEKLLSVDRAENLLREFNLGQLRVRHHDTIARIEVLPESFPEVVRQAEAIVAALRECGFRYVALDLAGYRTGSMNEVLDLDKGT